MDRELWQTSKRALTRALELGPEARRAYLEELYARFPGLRAELDSLLSAYERNEAFLEHRAPLPELRGRSGPGRSRGLPGRLAHYLGERRALVWAVTGTSLAHELLLGVGVIGGAVQVSGVGAHLTPVILVCAGCLAATVAWYHEPPPARRVRAGWLMGIGVAGCLIVWCFTVGAGHR